MLPNRLRWLVLLGPLAGGPLAGEHTPAQAQTPIAIDSPAPRTGGWFGRAVVRATATRPVAYAHMDAPPGDRVFVIDNFSWER